MNVELRKKEDIIKSKEIELDEMKQKIERIENSPNIPNIESYYKSDICRKIVNRKATDFSALTNETINKTNENKNFLIFPIIQNSVLCFWMQK